jgi:hypothetical protein
MVDIFSLPTTRPKNIDKTVFFESTRKLRAWFPQVVRRC